MRSCGTSHVWSGEYEIIQGFRRDLSFIDNHLFVLTINFRNPSFSTVHFGITSDFVVEIIELDAYQVFPESSEPIDSNAWVNMDESPSSKGEHHGTGSQGNQSNPGTNRDRFPNNGNQERQDERDISPPGDITPRPDPTPAPADMDPEYMRHQLPVFSNLCNCPVPLSSSQGLWSIRCSSLGQQRGP